MTSAHRDLPGRRGRDQLLLARIREARARGDARASRAAADELIARHLPDVRKRVAMKLGVSSRRQEESEIVVSMALVRLASALPAMHATREASLIALIGSCVDLAVVDFIRLRVRRRQRERITEPQTMAEPAVQDVSPQEQAEALAEVLVGLNQRDREIVVERAVVEITPEQVAVRRKMSRGAVDATYSRALAKLRTQAESADDVA